MIQVNSLTDDDINELLIIAKQFHDESYYKDESFDNEKLGILFKNCNHYPTKLSVFVYKKDGKIVGGILGHISERFFSHEKIAGDYGMFLLPSERNGKIFLRLFKEFETWAIRNGASKIMLGHTTKINMDKAENFYKKLGFELQGFLFSKEIK